MTAAIRTDHPDGSITLQPARFLTPEELRAEFVEQQRPAKVWNGYQWVRPATAQGIVVTAHEPDGKGGGG